jgi:uridine kinase
VTPERQAMLSLVVDRIVRLRSRALRVAIDGVDGVGKTRFGDELAAQFAAIGRPTIRASADGFHHPRTIRYQRGRDSPEGFYRDSYDVASLREHLLDPLGPGGSRRYRRHVFDIAADLPNLAPIEHAPADAILLLDGLFLHRLELRACWDLSIFLQAPFAISIPRGASRGPGFGSPDPDAPGNRRYIEGQRLYFRECDPVARATLVIDNSDIDHPRFLSVLNHRHHEQSGLISP